MKKLQLVFLVLMAGMAYWIYGVDAETHQTVRDYAATHAWVDIVAVIIGVGALLLMYFTCYAWWISSLGSKLSVEMAENTVKQGRNEPCACGSGLKFKNCCALRHKMAREPGAMIDSSAHIASQTHPIMAILFWPFLAIHKRLCPFPTTPTDRNHR